jgi:TRAP-type C4-dicarboxylate transport system substrate-binding protein
MKKSKVFISVVLCLIIFSMTICAAQASYQYEWRLPQVHPVGSDYDLRAVAFADEVREKTEGRIDITVYSGGVLCDWVECYERVMRGDPNL